MFQGFEPSMLPPQPREEVRTCDLSSTEENPQQAICGCLPRGKRNVTIFSVLAGLALVILAVGLVVVYAKTVSHADRHPIDRCSEQSGVSGQSTAKDPQEYASLRPFLLRELRGKPPFVFMPNPGNAGDALIQYSTMLLFKFLNLRFYIGDPGIKYTNTTLVYAGAGNLVGLYPFCEHFLKRNAPQERGNKIILLPATVRNVDHLLPTLGENVIIFARERVTYEYLKLFMKHKKNVYLSRDCATYIPHLDPMIREYRSRYPQGRKVGFIFRKDAEAIGTVPGSIDLPAILPQVRFNYWRYHRHVLHDPQPFIDNVKETVRLIYLHMANYTVMHANHIHMCIAATFMQRETYCYSGSYWKNRAMYMYALTDYENLHFEINKKLPDLKHYA